MKLDFIDQSRITSLQFQLVVYKKGTTDAEFGLFGPDLNGENYLYVLIF